MRLAGRSGRRRVVGTIDTAVCSQRRLARWRRGSQRGRTYVVAPWHGKDWGSPLSRSTAADCQEAPAQRPARRAMGVPLWLLVAAVMALCYFAQPLNLFYTVVPAASVDSHILAIREGSPARQVSLLLAGIWAMASLVVRRSRLQVGGLLAVLALLFLFIAAASIGWAEDPLLSAKRTTVLIAVAVCCVAIAEQVGFNDAASLAFWSSALAAGASVGAEFALGTFSPLDPAYRFAGMMHPNVQGLYCACLTLAGVSLARRHRTRRGAYAGGAAIGFALLLLTKSRESLASVVAGLTLYAVLTSARARYWLLIASTAAAIAAVPLLFADRHDVASLWTLLQMGRQEDVSTLATLTGRTELWQSLLDYVYERPVLGYGYGGFWTPSRITALARREGWELGSAHSQYFEIALSVGVLGLVVYCGTGLTALWRLVSRYWRSRDDASAFGAALVVLVAVGMLAGYLPLEPSVPMVSCLTIVAGLAFVRGWMGTGLRR
jgi:O-antigen ligase